MPNGQSPTETLELEIPTYLPLSEAAEEYNLSENVLTQLIRSGKIEAVRLPSGEILVAADKNGQDVKSKDEIIAERFAHLKDERISASAASRKYSKIHGITISHPNFSRWAKAGYIRVIERGYRLQMDEADVAYCAEIYAQKYEEYDGQMIGVRVFDENGNPYQLKYPEVAEQMRTERRTARQHTDRI